jgi:hypothetical protein
MNPERAKNILSRMRQLEIRTRRLVNDTLAGEYHSVFKGRGMDFDDVREYVAGDEVRTIDWNVTARAGRPFVKKFTEERELTILLLVDVSASGNFGSAAQSKRELAAELASVLAFSAIRNSDKVGLIYTPVRSNYTFRPRKAAATFSESCGKFCIYNLAAAARTRSRRWISPIASCIGVRLRFSSRTFSRRATPTRHSPTCAARCGRPIAATTSSRCTSRTPAKSRCRMWACSPSRTRKPTKWSNSTPPTRRSAPVSRQEVNDRTPTARARLSGRGD